MFPVFLWRSAAARPQFRGNQSRRRRDRGSARILWVAARFRRRPRDGAEAGPAVSIHGPRSRARAAGWRWCTAMERGKAACGWIPRSPSTPSDPGRRPSHYTGADRRRARKWGGGADPTPALESPFCPAPEPGSQVEGGDNLIRCPIPPPPPPQALLPQDES
uniref:Uncharacterized protein n=1 Tax=Molossus molossus TaxID=27622 RepID=A0A7J8C8E3_MOLMO|nr:hypothetical protein HJG59_009837 [Molossus molossus]